MSFLFRELELRDQTELQTVLKHLTKKEPILDVESLLLDPAFVNVVVENEKGRMVGFGSLCLYRSAVKGVTGVIEDIVVEKESRGLGLGKKIVGELIERAGEMGVRLVTLTSNSNNPERAGAIRIYELFGFQASDTTFFVKEL